MKLLTITLAIILFILASFVSNAKNDSIAENIFKLIYNEQFEEAEKVLIQSKNQIGPFYAEILDIDLCWWKYIQSNEKKDSEKLLEQISVLEQSGNSTEGKIKQLVARSYKIRYFLKKYNVIGATVIRSEIKNLLEEIKNGQPPLYGGKRMELFYIYDALFLYFDNMFNPFFLEKKRLNRSAALKKIEEFTETNYFIAQTLSNYFLGKIYLNIENDPEKAKICFQRLSGKYPQNEVFSSLLSKCDEKISPKDFSDYNQY